MTRSARGRRRVRVGPQEGVGARRPKIGLVAKLKGALGVLLVPFAHADAYRPERHYMRGPGPKALAKNRPRQDVDGH
jgi:hypothetical protein